MSKSKQEYLSPIQVSAIMASAIIGVVVLTLPRLAAQTASHGAVPSVFLAGVMSLILTIIAVNLGKRLPDQTFVEYSISILGGLLGRVLGLFVVGYFIIIAGMVLRSFADTLKVFMLPKTPIEFIIISMLIVVIYMIHNGIGAIAKICETFLPVTVITIFLVIVLNIPDFQTVNLFPIFTNGLFTTLLEAIKGIPKLFTAFLGFEVVLFIIPFMQKPEKVSPYAIAAVIFPTLIYTGLVAICIGVFGMELTSKMLYPTMSLARSITFPGAFAERFDILFGVLWVLAAFSATSISYYIASLSITRLLKLKNYRPFIFILLPLVYITAIMPQNIYQMNQIIEIAGYLGMIMTSIPIPLLAIIWIKNKGGKAHASKK